MAKWPTLHFRFAVIYGDAITDMYRRGGDGAEDEVCAEKFEGDGLRGLASPPKLTTTPLLYSIAYGKMADFALPLCG